jgi:hypothetical protein
MSSVRDESTEASVVTAGQRRRRGSELDTGGSSIRMLVVWAMMAGLLCVVAGCNTHPVEYAELTGEFEREINAGGSSSAALDVLWVIDNSSSMCQEQNALGSQFEQFIGTLEERNADFHISVTTTQPENPGFRVDPIAVHGEIQSQPYPRIPNTSECKFAYDEQGQPQGPGNASNQWGNFQPIRNHIQKALNCTKNPEQQKQNFRDKGLYEENSSGKPVEPSDKKLACATGNDQACNAMSDQSLAMEIDDSINSGDGRPFLPTPFFDDEQESPYIDIPKVLRASDYRASDGTLQTQKLRQDFACMSFVGLYGSTFEAGLSSARTAVSLEKTGGASDLNAEEQNALDPDDDGTSEFDTEAPNHGFLRKDARFATIFVSDENDCSTDQPVSDLQRNACGDAVCYFPTKGNGPGEQSPLSSTTQMREDFLENLRISKGMTQEEFEDYRSNVYVASIHGDADKETVQPAPDSCTQGAKYKAATCKSEFGIAYTGDRYDDFLKGFDRSNRFPSGSEESPDAPLTGYICEGTLLSAFNAIEEIIPESGQNCITADVRPCDRDRDGTNDCPMYTFGSESSGSAGNLCQEFGMTGGKFCDSSIRVELDASGFDDPENKLQTLGGDYCIEESIGATPSLKNKCVVSRSKYSWADCGSTGIRFQWNNAEQARSVTSGLEATIRYHRVELDDESNADGGMSSN